jgi:hypothetical protein
MAMPPELMAALQGAPSASADDQNASVTSREDGSDLDLVRHAIQALQLYAERTHDDQELQVVHKAIVALQGILAGHAKNQDAALGISPALKHVRRVSRGSGY